MARYIDADKFRQELIFKQLYCGDDIAERHALGIVIAELDGTPTADVVPKSEVERLEHILNCYALQYGTVTDQQEVIDKAKAEVAREIFEEIEKLLKSQEAITENQRMKEVVDWVFQDYLPMQVAELKKKYTEEQSNA